MGEIRKTNLHESLIEYMQTLGLTEEQIKEYIENELELDGLQTESKDLVGAINELFQNANNGKELIASAIGEPVSSEDTFQAMSDKIIGIKEDLKTVLTDEGVEVEEDNLANLVTKMSEEFVNSSKYTTVQYKENTTEHFNTGTLSGVKAENDSLVPDGTNEGYRLSPAFNIPTANYVSTNINWEGDGKIYLTNNIAEHVVNSSFTFPSVITKYSFESAPFTTYGSYALDPELGVKVFDCTSEDTAHNVGGRLLPTSAGFSVFFRFKTSVTTNPYFFLNENGWSNRSIRLYNNALAYQYAYGGKFTYVTSSITVNDGKWHTALLTFTSSACRIIIDGIERANAAYAGLDYGTDDTFYCCVGISYSYFVVCSTILPDNFGLPTVSYVEHTKNNSISSSIDLTKSINLKQVVNQNQSISNVNLTFTLPYQSTVIYPS